MSINNGGKTILLLDNLLLSDSLSKIQHLLPHFKTFCDMSCESFLNPTEFVYSIRVLLEDIPECFSSKCSKNFNKCYHLYSLLRLCATTFPRILVRHSIITISQTAGHLLGHLIGTLGYLSDTFIKLLENFYWPSFASPLCQSINAQKDSFKPISFYSCLLVNFLGLAWPYLDYEPDYFVNFT